MFLNQLTKRKIKLLPNCRKSVSNYKPELLYCNHSLEKVEAKEAQAHKV